MHGEINAYFDNILSKLQHGFRKDSSKQQCLLHMMEKIRKIRDSEGVFAAVFTDLSKAFDSISHEVLLAKLHPYSFDKISLTFMHGYLSQRQQETKVGSTFTKLMSALFDFPNHLSQGHFYLKFIFEICLFSTITLSLEAMQMIPLLLFTRKILTKYFLKQKNIQLRFVNGFT